jgi:hypothetical protein
MKSVKIFGAIFFLVLCVSLAAAAKDKREWKTGKLVSVTDSSSSRVIGNSQTGAIQTVEDVEYRVSILLDGIVYVGSYWPRLKWSYAPTDFVVNDPIELSIDGNEMRIRRPAGKEFKAKVIRRIRQEDTNAQPLPGPHR